MSPVTRADLPRPSPAAPPAALHTARCLARHTRSGCSCCCLLSWFKPFIFAVVKGPRAVQEGEVQGQEMVGSF